MGFRVSGFRVKGLGFRVWGLGFRDFGLRVSGVSFSGRCFQPDSPQSDLASTKGDELSHAISFRRISQQDLSAWKHFRVDR